VAQPEIAKLSAALSPSPINSTVEVEVLEYVPPNEFVSVADFVFIVPAFENVPSIFAASVPVPTIIVPLLVSPRVALPELLSVIVGVLPKGTSVFAAIVRVRLVVPLMVLLISTLLKVTPGAEKDVSTFALLSRLIVPELCVKVPAVMVKLRPTLKNPEVAVKLPPVIEKVPARSIVESPPANVPPFMVNPVFAVVAIVIPVLWVTVPA
jgi:hypothetical protein